MSKGKKKRCILILFFLFFKNYYINICSVVIVVSFFFFLLLLLHIKNFDIQNQLKLYLFNYFFFQFLALIVKVINWHLEVEKFCRKFFMRLFNLFCFSVFKEGGKGEGKILSCCCWLSTGCSAKAVRLNALTLTLSGQFAAVLYVDIG